MLSNRTGRLYRNRNTRTSRPLAAATIAGAALFGVAISASPALANPTYPTYPAVALHDAGIGTLGATANDAATSEIEGAKSPRNLYYGQSSSHYSVNAHETKAASQADDFEWSTFIANTGGQEAVDLCAGGLTDMTALVGLDHQRYYPIHNQCGGEPILRLQVGDDVFIAGLGKFVVSGYRVVNRGDTTDALDGLGGSVLVQTCYDVGPEMRVVALDSAWE